MDVTGTTACTLCSDLEIKLMFTPLGPRIPSLRVYDRKSFTSFYVQAVVPVILVSNWKMNAVLPDFFQENYRMGGNFVWPKVSEVAEYREKVRQTMLDVIDNTPLELPVTQESKWV